LMQAPKNGFFYVLDRATGELISAQNYVDVSWASHVDLATGRPVERPEAQWGEQQRVVTPSIVGGHNWNPMSFSPRTGLVYVPTISAAYPFTPDPKFRYTRGRMNTAEDLGTVSAAMEGYEDAFRFCTPTHLSAWDPVAQRQAWRVTHDAIVPGGTLATAGDLVFQGRGDGVLVAYDARSGAPLWESRVGVGIMAPPISYRVAGEQYIAVLSGIGGSLALDFSRHERENIGRILAWKLEGKAPMPETPLLAAGRVEAPALPTSAADVARGQRLYADHCLRCHGAGVKSSMLMPDLRFASREVHEQWSDIVLGGTRAAQGMASFADVISESDARAIHAYVISRALHEPGRLEQLAAWLGQSTCIPVSWMAD
jgi:quinohemoprotein ethanol dehydrogenase